MKRPPVQHTKHKGAAILSVAPGPKIGNQNKHICTVQLLEWAHVKDNNAFRTHRVTPGAVVDENS